jgi:hypothetical protein
LHIFDDSIDFFSGEFSSEELFSDGLEREGIIPNERNEDIISLHNRIFRDEFL